MPAIASQIFDSLEQHQTCLIERHEIASPAFGALRRALRSIVRRLGESDDDDAQETSNKIRSMLSEWLTVPVPFDDAIFDAVRALGEPAAVSARWGTDVGASHAAALGAAEDLSETKNPVREKLCVVMRELRTQKRAFKIYCHRRARPHFETSLIPFKDPPLDETAFLHSVRDYRESAPFDTLIKVGPLRSWGWGSAPDALISAPRFGTLVQVVWAGCVDEPDFGYDPVSPPLNAELANNSPTPVLGSSVNCISWSRQVMRTGDDPGSVGGFAAEEDEFQLFQELNQPREKRRATLVQIAGNAGILYPPHSQVISFDPSLQVPEPIGLRLPGEALGEGMFVILPVLGDVDLGGMQVAEGRYSRIWKERLREELRVNPEGICRILRNNGVALRSLRACVENWAMPATGVIHAPQQRAHFEILIRMLAIDFGDSPPHGAHGIPWWQHAWNEIRISRGEAIQAGVHEQVVIEEQVIGILKRHLSKIRSMAAKPVFNLPISVDSGLSGVFMFYKVVYIEEGFLAPGSDLKSVRDLNTIEQWRV